MTGHRVELTDDETHKLKPGEYCRCSDGWRARTPNGHAANLTAHEVQEHEDGTITVSPSIEVSSSRPDGSGEMVPYTVYHGYLERGVWRDA